MDAFTEQERAKIQKFVSDAVNGRETKARPASGARRRRSATDPRAARHEKRADAWVTWFHAHMKEAGSSDPAEFLPDMAALIEQRIDERIAAELAPARRRIRELELAAGTSVTAWKIDPKAYRLIPLLANGQMGAPLDLLVLFEQFWRETGGVS